MRARARLRVRLRLREGEVRGGRGGRVQFDDP